ncbi:MAG: prepilin-type N-terminal cleavage/methylation domain-containing protein [Gemmatimonadetes bacterium]|nr:prepilin-type N-terminal cleavage/methylation domain-containing protein [Gemmatimonadota bacterium]
MRAHAEPVPRGRRGFSLIEVTVAMTIFLLVLSFSLPFFNSQSRAVSRASGQGDMTRALQFALAQIDRDLRMAGAGTYAQQPMLVQIGANAITFNANMASADSADVRSVYYDPDADPTTMTSLTTSAKITLPTSGTRQYPDTNYIISGIRSPAETISYWVSSDSSTSRTDDYILWRRENLTTPVIIARGIIIGAGGSIFSYVKSDTGGAVSTVTGLPRYHNAPIHGSPGDSGAYAMIDSVRVVNISLTGSYDDPRTGSRTVTVTTAVRVANSGLVQRTTCGESPVFGKTITAVIGSSPLRVTLSWLPSVDESTGEKDVEQYAVFRRAAAASAFDEPIDNVAAGLATYTWIDTNISSGDSWVYGVAAMDCSPALSPPSVTGTVTIP